MSTDTHHRPAIDVRTNNWQLGNQIKRILICWLPIPENRMILGACIGVEGKLTMHNFFKKLTLILGFSGHMLFEIHFEPK